MPAYLLRSVASIHLILALFIVGALSIVGGPFGSLSAASAAEADTPSARLQLLIKEVKINDDREGDLSGLAELSFGASIWRCKDGELPPCFNEGEHNRNASLAGVVARASGSFYANSGDTVLLNRLVPGINDRSPDPESSYAKGFAVYAGHPYVVRLVMVESDDGYSVNEDMGEVVHIGNTADGSLGLGTFTVESINGDGGHVGDFAITYEIRKAPLPDLRVGGIKVHDLVGTPRKLVCMGVANHEPYDADAFEAVLTVDGLVPPGGRASAGHLKGGDSADMCVEVALPTTGQHKLEAVADASHLVTEYNETNNVYQMPWPATPPKPGAARTGAAEAGAAPPDLTISAIKVDSRVPDGKDDCKAGENVVSVTVKNDGQGPAGSFATRLTVDGVNVARQSAIDLGAGQQRDVRFDGVQLKKGQHELTATADAPNVDGPGIAESDEGNNSLRVSVTCKGG